MDGAVLGYTAGIGCLPLILQRLGSRQSALMSPRAHQDPRKVLSGQGS